MDFCEEGSTADWFGYEVRRNGRSVPQCQTLAPESTRRRSAFGCAQRGLMGVPALGKPAAIWPAGRSAGRNKTSVEWLSSAPSDGRRRANFVVSRRSLMGVSRARLLVRSFHGAMRELTTRREVVEPRIFDA